MFQVLKVDFFVNNKVMQISFKIEKDNMYVMCNQIYNNIYLMWFVKMKVI